MATAAPRCARGPLWLGVGHGGTSLRSVADTARPSAANTAAADAAERGDCFSFLLFLLFFFAVAVSVFAAIAKRCRAVFAAKRRRVGLPAQRAAAVAKSSSKHERMRIVQIVYEPSSR